MADALARQSQLQPREPGPNSDYRLAVQSYMQFRQSGNQLDLQQSSNLAIHAHQKQPDHIPTINLLALIHLKLEHFEQALQWARTGLAVRAESPQLLFTAGKIALRMGDLKSAEGYFQESARISRVATDAQRFLADVWLLQGRYTDAFLIYRELIKTQPDNNSLQTRLFNSANQLKADFYNPDLATELAGYLELEQADPAKLSHLSISMLEAWLAEYQPYIDNSLAGWIEALQQPLLLNCLKAMPLASPVLESVLTQVRGNLLFDAAKNLSLRQNQRPLISALISQIHLNEGCWAISECETKLLNQLNLLSDRLLRVPSPAETDLQALGNIVSLLLAYHPLNRLSIFPSVLEWLPQHRIQVTAEWPQDLLSAIDSAIQEQLELQKQQQDLTCPRDIQNPVSIRVQQQYNHYPYPRWSVLGNFDVVNYADAVRAHFPSALDFWRPPEQQIDILVAGCGTGRHAIQLARYFRPVRVTGIDIGESSLAYARKKAEQYQTEIDWRLLDILNACQLGKQFDVIECSGVLHHMESPLAGLRALTQVLKPGGLIKIALYSRRARRLISAFRKEMANLSANDDQLRLIRQAILNGEMEELIPGDWNVIKESPDFYNLSGCRDLLCHEQEHVFDIENIEQELLEPCGLRWVGMLAPDADQAASKSRRTATSRTGNTGEGIGNSPEYWAEQEDENPKLFNRMYQFYAIRA